MLRIDHACYRYAPSDSWALDDASVTIEPGEHVVLLGRNGSGKSTLAQLANGSLLPQRGCVSIDGVGIGAAGSDEADGLAGGDASYAASRVAFVRQDPARSSSARSLRTRLPLGRGTWAYPRTRSVSVSLRRSSPVASLRSGPVRRPRSPVGSSSASPWPARLPCIPPTSCSTRSPPSSTARRAGPCVP